MSYRVSGGKRLALFIIGILALLLLAYQTTDLSYCFFPHTHAEAGYIDLSNLNFRTCHPVNLDGQWEFYWKQLLTSSNINSVRPDFYADVPSTWNRYTLDGEPLPGFGYGTYRLRVRTILEPGTKMSFQLCTVSSAYSLYVNDSMIASNGVVTSDPALSRPEHRPQTANFTVPAKEFDVILQVSNYNHARGGVWYSIILGSTEGVADLHNRRGNRQLFFSGILAFITLTYFCLFVLLRKAREYMYLTLLALDAIILTSTMHPALLYRLFPQLSFHWLIFLTYASISWTVALLALFTEEMFPARYSRQVVRGIVIYTVVLTLMYALTPVQFYTGISTILNIIGLLPLIFVLYLSLRGIKKGIEGSGSYLFGFIFAAFTYIHDTLLVNNYIHSDVGELVYVGCAVMFFVQTVAHALRFTQAYNQNIMLLDRLHWANRQKDEFLFNTAHQIRSPLAAITALAEKLMAKSEVAATENLAQIKAFGSRAANMVNDILDYSYLGKGEVSLQLEPMDLRAVAKNVLHVFRMTGQGKYESIIPPDLPQVLADENRLYQVLYNLVDNLRLYSSGKIQVSAETRGNFIAVSVSSNEEVPPQVLSTLRDYVDTDKHVGDIPASGLPLAITRHLVDLQGGSIQVKAAGGQGVAICFTLPAAGKKLLSGAKGIGQEKAVEGISIKGQGPHILIVDGNVESLNATAKILGLNGFAVTAVNKGESALAHIRQSKFAAVLLDLVIPDKSGYEVCREIRTIHSALELPVLILAVRTAAKDIALAFEAGANDYLAKPFETEVLLARVRTLAYLKQSMDKAVASELAFLQAQIKPHFLFNALSAIAALTIADPLNAQSLILHLSNYLRHSFRFSEADIMVPLAKEIELVQAYVAIEKARFSSHLDLQVVIDEYPEATVPRLILQPLVENALRHGIFKKAEGGIVQIRMEKKVDHLHFSVKDNGVGMDKDKVMSLLSGDLGQGVGLVNIHKRLLRYYGRGLTIESLPGQGTTVTFSIPVQS